MTEEIRQFIEYLVKERKVSKNTEVSYQRDLFQMADYLESQGIHQTEKVTETSLNSYILYLEKEGRAATTVSRAIASVRAFFHYAVREHWIQEDPSEFLKAPRIEKKLPDILSQKEVEMLLAQPSGNSLKEIRDKAMLELMYATGLRVSELIGLSVDDLNMSVGFLRCRDEKKERMIPFGKTAKAALSRYLENARERLLKGNESNLLFVNCSGKAMSRQGFWKILKHYGEMADIKTAITPHTLRHSFAAHLLSSGADIHTVQTMMGHAGIGSTQMYAAVATKKNKGY